MVEMKKGVGDQKKGRIETGETEMEYEYILFNSIVVKEAWRIPPGIAISVREIKYLKDLILETGHFFHVLYKKLGRPCSLNGSVMREGEMRWESPRENGEVLRHTKMRGELWVSWDLRLDSSPRPSFPFSLTLERFQGRTRSPNLGIVECVRYLFHCL